MRAHLGVSAVLLILSSVAGATPSKSQKEYLWPAIKACPPDKVSALEEKEMQHEEEGHPDKAMDTAKEILKLCPNDYRSMNVIAGLHGTLNEPEKELEWSTKALKINRRYWQALINQGNAYFALKKLDKAKVSYDRAKKINPSGALPYYHLGLIEDAKGRPKRSRVLYQKSVELDNKFEPGFYNLAAAEANLGHIEAAKRHLKKVLDLNPNAEDAKKMLEELEKREKDKQK